MDDNEYDFLAEEFSEEKAKAIAEYLSLIHPEEKQDIENAMHDIPHFRHEFSRAIIGMAVFIPTLLEGSSEAAKEELQSLLESIHFEHPLTKRMRIFYLNHPGIPKTFADYFDMKEEDVRRRIAWAVQLIETPTLH